MDGMLWLILIIISIKSSVQDCARYNSDTSWEDKLRSYLISRDDKLEIPCNKDGVEVKVSFALKWFNYDSNEGVFMIYSWMHLAWDNNRFTWNPADYDGLNSTLLRTMYFWEPQMRIINSEDEDYDEYTYSTTEPCEISSSGRFVCNYKIADRVICASDLTKWPYDTQTCSVKLGVKANQNGTVRFKTTGRFISMIGAEYGSEWDIMEYKQIENPGAEAKLEMIFSMDRHAESLAALLIYPSLALSVLSVTSFTLDVRRNIRLGLACFSLANHFSFFVELQEHIPGHSVYPPTLLFFYRASMLINVLLVLLTFILDVMCKRQKSPPYWICAVNDRVFKSSCKFFVWPKWDAEFVASEFAEPWTNFANIINNVLFIVVIIVYVSMYFVYIPQPLPLNY